MTHKFNGCPFCLAKVCSGNPWRACRGQQRSKGKVRTPKEAHTCRCAGFWQPRKRERKQEVKSWKYTGNVFLFQNVLSLYYWIGRERGKKTTKPVCSVSWGNPFHTSVLLFPELSNKATAFPWLALIPAYQQPEILRKEKGKHAAEPGFLKPPHMAISAPGVLSEGSVFRNHQQRSWPIVPCAVQTHSEGPSLPQRTYPTNRNYRGNVARELETSCLAQGCTAGCGRQRQKPGILISSPAICSFSPTTTFCLQGVNGTKDNSVWLGIFNRWQLHIQAHTLLDSVAPRDRFPLLALTQFGGCSAGMRWPSEQKFDTRKGKGGPGSCEIWLLKHLHVLQHKLKKLFVWKI